MELDIFECMKLEQLPQGIEHLTCINEVLERICEEGNMDYSKVKHIQN